MAQWQKVKFFWETMLGSPGSSLTATSTASGFDVKNIYNMLETNMWKAANTTNAININLDLGAGNTAIADYIAIYGHNIFTAGGKLSMWCSNDNFISDIRQAGSYITPASDGVVLNEFTATAPSRYWRFVIESIGGGAFSAVPYMTICIWGNKTELDYVSAGFDPYEEEIKANVLRGDTGYVLGVHDRYRERRMTLRFEDAEDELYQKIKDWWDGNGLKNFFVGWERGNRLDDVFLMMPEPRFNNPFKLTGRRDITINLIGRRE